MGWNDYRQQNAGNMKKKTTRRFPPWQASVLMPGAGEEFDIALVDVSPFHRPHHWTQFPHECTASNPLFEGKCIYCHDAAQRDHANDQLQARNMEPERYKHYLHDGVVVPVLDLRMFHFVPDAQKADKFTVAECAYPDAQVAQGSPPNLCAHCKARDPYVAERRFLGVRRWEMDSSSELWASVIAADRRANQTCMHVYPDGTICRGKNYLTQIICPDCGEEFLGSEAIHSDLGKAQELAEKNVSCTKCPWKGKPYSAYTCMNAGKRGTADCPEHMAVPGTLATGLVRIAVRGDTRKDGQTVRKYSVEPLLTEDKVEALVSRFGFDPDAAVTTLSGKDLDLSRAYVPERKNPDDDAFNKGGAFDRGAYVTAVLTSQAEDLGIRNPYSSGGATDHVPFGKSTRTYESASTSGRD